MSTNAGGSKNKEGGAPTALPVGTEYGVPSTAVQARGGEAQVKVSADVADRFEAAKAKHDAHAGPLASNINSETHKSGMEPVADRARNLTEVTEAKMQGAEETRSPNIGFPAREHIH